MEDCLNLLKIYITSEIPLSRVTDPDHAKPEPEVVSTTILAWKKMKLYKCPLGKLASLCVVGALSDT